MKNYLLILLMFTILSCNNKSTEKIEDNTIITDLPIWAKSANIYEVNLRQFTPEGTINAFREHLPRLKEMGVDILWFMPIYPISTTKKKGTLGSYYSVSNFLDINPEFGTMDDMDALIKDIHGKGMKIILDWVPNHTGWDHHWITENPDWYTHDDEGNIIDPHNDEGESHGWTDVADLNYNNQEMRIEMLKQLKWWVQEKDIDGYRMDIAFGVPLDFWHTVRDTLYSIKPIFMLAESEDAPHRNDSIFHATYGWNLFHAMNDIAKGDKTIAEFKKIHAENAEKFSRGNTLIFTSNHDENAWNGSAPERLGAGMKGWAVIMALLDGVPLIYSGMEEPMQKRLEFFEKDTINFDKLELADFYSTLWQLKKDNSSLWNFPFGSKVEWLEHDSILAFTRKDEKSQISVFFNPSEKPVFISSNLLKGTDVFTNTSIIDTEKNLLPFQFLIVKK